MTASEADMPGSAASGRPASSAASGTAAAPRVAGAREAVMRAPIQRPALAGLLALVAYLAVSIACYGYRLIGHPGLPQLSPGQVDPNFYIWSLRWWPYAISHGLNPLYSRQIGAPAGFNLAWTTTTPALAIVISPVTALFGPITSLNLTLVLAAPVSAWAAFLAARRLTGRFWASLAGGTIYGFSPYEVGHTGAGQANLALIMLIPFMVYLALLWRDGKLRDWLFAGLLALAFAVEFYIFNEAFIEMTVLSAAGLLIGFALARPADRRTIARLAGLAAVAWVISIVLASPYIVYSLRHYPAGFTKATAANSMNLNIAVGFASSIPLLVILVALAVFTWSSRLTWLLVILFVLIVALAVGPRPAAGARQFGSLPWARIWSLPLARSIEPTRLSLFLYLVLAIVVALWLAAPTRDAMLLAGRWAIGLVAVALIIVHVPYVWTGNALPASHKSAAARPSGALPAFISSGLYRDYLRPGELVVVVSQRGNAGMLFQADTDFYFRLAGGFINVTLSNTSALPTPVEGLMHPTPAAEQQFRAYVRQAGVGAILVERAWSAPWMGVFSQMGLHGTAVGGMIVYRTG
jgi:hypothetical protein